MRPWPVRILPLLLLCLFTPVLASESKRAPESALESVMTMRVESQIRLDETGKLVEFKIETAMKDGLRQALERMVREWRFTPAPSPDGFSRQTVSPMRLTLAATRVGEGYRVKVDNVIFPNADKSPTKAEPAAIRITGKRMMPPAYPADQARNGVSGVVLVSLRVGADGRVEEAISVQSMLINATASNGGFVWALKEFEIAALRAARRWQFDVPPVLSQAEPRLRTVNVPVHFKSHGESGPGEWRFEVRTPRSDVPWLRQAPGQQQVGVSDMAPGEVLPAVGLVKLDTNVIGMDVM